MEIPMPTFANVMRQRRVLAEFFPKIIHAQTADEQDDLFYQTKTTFLRHMANEEDVFYKMLGLKIRALKDKVADAKNGHDEIRKYLELLGRKDLSYEEWMLTLGELKHSIFCHIKVEEDLFKQVKKNLKDREISNLIKKLEETEEKIFEHLPASWRLGAGAR